MKSAFTMIELIFAIVVIGISVLTIPIMTQVNSSSIETNIAQEVIFGASAKMAQTLSYPWADTSIEINASASDAFEHIVNINPSSPAYDASNRYGRYPDLNSTRRIGTFAFGKRRSFFDNNATGGNDDYATSDANTTSLRDFSSVVSYDYKNSGINNSTGYKNPYTNKVTVLFVTDTISNTGHTYKGKFSNTASAGPTNLKLVKIDVVKTGEANIITSLFGYAANIGQIEELKYEVY